MTRVVETVESDEPLDPPSVLDRIEASIEEIGGVTTIAVTEQGDHGVVTATTKPTFRSWGEELTIHVREFDIEIRCESDQLYDWRRSRSLVDTVSKRVNSITGD